MHMPATRASTAALLAAAAAIAALAPALASAQEVVRVCVLDRPPIARCSLISPSDPHQWEQEGGFAVRLFEQAWSNARVSDATGASTPIFNTTIAWICMNEQTNVMVGMLSSADKANRSCDAMISSTTVTSERKKMGLIFSYPFASPALSTAVKGSAPSRNGLFWLQPFTPALWGTIAGTLLLFVPAMIAVFLTKHDEAADVGPPQQVQYPAVKLEDGGGSNASLSTAQRSQPAGNPLKRWLQNFAFGVFNSLSVVLHGDNHAWNDLHPPHFVKRTWVARSFFFFVFGFVTLVLISAYTANFSAVLVLPSVGSDITDPAQLYGKPVLTAKLYFEHLRNRFGIQPKDAGVTNADSMMRAVSQVADGEFAGVVYDFPMLVWAVSTHNTQSDTCIRLLDHRFLPRQYAFAFAAGFNLQYVDAFSNELNKLDDEGELARQRELAWESITAGGGSSSLFACGQSGRSDRLGITDVWVLFAILGGGGLLSLLLYL